MANLKTDQLYRQALDYSSFPNSSSKLGQSGADLVWVARLNFYWLLIVPRDLE